MVRLAVLPTITNALTFAKKQFGKNKKLAKIRSEKQNLRPV